MRRIRFVLALLAAAATALSASADGMVEYITDMTVQERAIQSEAASAGSDEGVSPVFFIEPEAVVEAGASAADYADIARGDSGDAVLKLQKRLIQLGYLTDLSIDGTYGANTASAMHDFKLACGIDEPEAHDPADCPASAQAQAVLFSDAAVPYNDPAFPVEILKENGIHAKEDSTYLSFRPEIRNESHAKTVASFTLDCYATDIWGNRVVGETMSYEWTTNREITPGAVAEADSMTVPERIRIAWLYVAVTRVTFTDGTALEPDAPYYVGWTPVEW